MVLGQYGREVLEWRTGGRGLRGRVCKAVWKDSVRMRVRRSASRCSGAEGVKDRRRGFEGQGVQGYLEGFCEDEGKTLC